MSGPQMAMVDDDIKKLKAYMSRSDEMSEQIRNLERNLQDTSILKRAEKFFRQFLIPDRDETFS